MGVGALGIELCEILHLIVLDCIGYEKASTIYNKWNKVQSIMYFPSKIPYMVLFILYMVFVDCIS